MFRAVFSRIIINIYLVLLFIFSLNVFLILIAIFFLVYNIDNYILLLLKNFLANM